MAPLFVQETATAVGRWEIDIARPCQKPAISHQILSPRLIGLFPGAALQLFWGCSSEMMSRPPPTSFSQGPQSQSWFGDLCYQLMIQICSKVSLVLCLNKSSSPCHKNPHLDTISLRLYLVASKDPIGSKHTPRAPSLTSMGPCAPDLCEITLLTLPLSLVSLVLGLGTQWSQAMHCEAAPYHTDRQHGTTGGHFSSLKNTEGAKDSEVKRWEWLPPHWRLLEWARNLQCLKRRWAFLLFECPFPSKKPRNPM